MGPCRCKVSIHTPRSDRIDRDSHNRERRGLRFEEPRGKEGRRFNLSSYPGISTRLLYKYIMNRDPPVSLKSRVGALSPLIGYQWYCVESRIEQTEVNNSRSQPRTCGLCSASSFLSSLLVKLGAPFLSSEFRVSQQRFYRNLPWRIVRR